MIASRAPQAAARCGALLQQADGSRLRRGDLLRNPAYAATLHRSRRGPGRALSRPDREDIVRARARRRLPGSLSLEDLRALPADRIPGAVPPMAQYRVCTPPPPSGGVGVLQGLLLLAHTDIAHARPRDAIAWVQLGEAERLMYADRNRYVGDPAFVACRWRAARSRLPAERARR
jgi:gamma-glutamyltranspeptidase / glutathione hydrolase